MNTNTCQNRKAPENVPSIAPISPTSSCESDFDFSPKHIKINKKLKQIPSNEEVYLNGQLPEFCLFMMLSCILTASVVVGAISIACLMWKSSNSYLTTTDGEEPVMLIAAVLLLISSLIGILSVTIACMTQNQQCSELLLVLLFFSSLTFLLIGSSALVSLKLKSQWKFSPYADARETRHPIMGTHKKVVLEDCEIGRAFNKTLLRKFQEYNISDISKRSWDSTQKLLECCGVTGAEDWLTYYKIIPSSCCKLDSFQEEHCDLHSAFRDGCLDVLAIYLRWWLAILGGYGCVTLSFTVLMLMLIICLLIKVQRKKSVRRTSNVPSCSRPLVALGS